MIKRLPFEEEQPGCEGLDEILERNRARHPGGGFDRIAEAGNDHNQLGGRKPARNPGELVRDGKAFAVVPVTVNADKNEFVMTDANQKDHTIHLNKDGKVFINDKEGKIADLQAGEECTVIYELKDNKLMASEVRCKK